MNLLAEKGDMDSSTLKTEAALLPRRLYVSSNVYARHILEESIFTFVV
jgi:hypothetical protein